MNEVFELFLIISVNLFHPAVIKCSYLLVYEYRKEINGYSFLPSDNSGKFHSKFTYYYANCY